MMPKTLGREREEQRDREEGGGEGRRHDGRRILYNLAQPYTIHSFIVSVFIRRYDYIMNDL